MPELKRIAPDVPMIVLWEGERIDELPREKLYEIIHSLADDLDRERTMRLAESTRNMRALAKMAQTHAARQRPLVDRLLWP